MKKTNETTLACREDAGLLQTRHAIEKLLYSKDEKTRAVIAKLLREILTRTAQRDTTKRCANDFERKNSKRTAQRDTTKRCANDFERKNSKRTT